MEQQTPDYVAEGCSAIRERINHETESRQPLEIAIGHIALRADRVDAQNTNLKKLEVNK